MFSITQIFCSYVDNLYNVIPYLDQNLKLVTKEQDGIHAKIPLESIAFVHHIISETSDVPNKKFLIYS